jgi:tRNA threonylcarbamoyladenosine biosynthesis protein TsaE
MEDIAALLSVSTTSGDTILLDGDLGAGKTCFSRGFIRARTGYGGKITSPTYLLSNTYLAGGNGEKESDGGVKVHHLDLYRLNGTKEELIPLDLDNVFTNGIALIEWPERLIERPKRRLDVTLNIDVNDSNIMVSCDGEMDDERCRIMRLVPHGDRWVERLQFYESEGYFEDLIVENE